MPENPSAPHDPASDVGGAAPTSGRARAASLTVGGVLLVVILLVWFLGGSHDLEETVGFVTGTASSLAVTAGVVWWVRRRGGSSFSRGFDHSADERDKAIWRGAWAFTGKVAWLVPVVGLILDLAGCEVSLGAATTIAMWVNGIALFGARFWLDRRM